jgi:regulator of sigma E protease
MQIFLFTVAILLFIGLVLVHEWGHYIAARRNGVDVEEYGLGFPPRAWGKKLKNGMILSLNWLPLGGFVKLKGEYDADTRKGSFGAASLSAKTKILLAGVTMNLLVGLGLLTILALVGMPKLLDKDTIGEDQFTVASDNGTTVTKETTLRSKAEVEASLKTNNPKGNLGVEDPVNIQIQRSTWSAPVVALGFTVQLTKLTFIGLGHALGGLGSTIAGLVTANKEARQNGQTSASSQVGGPIAIVAVLWGSGSYGVSFILWIIAVLSLTLAIMNILPIPALDGGRLFMILFSRGVLKKPLSKFAEERIVATGMAIILSLVVLITIVDVKRFF